MSFHRLVTLALLLLLIGSPVDIRSAEKKEALSLSISGLEALDDEMIVSFSISVTAGAFQSIENIPIGWYLSIDNDASWQTKIKANTIVGAASISTKDFKRIKLIIIKNEFMDLKFALSGVVSLTKDYEKERQVPLRLSNFSIVPAK